jgi:hypothetical protein
LVTLIYKIFAKIAKKVLTVTEMETNIESVTKTETKERRTLVEEKVMFTVKMLAAYMNESIESLAEHAEINPAHLRNVTLGRAKITGDDILKLSMYTKIPIDQIAH